MQSGQAHSQGLVTSGPRCCDRRSDPGPGSAARGGSGQRGPRRWCWTCSGLPRERTEIWLECQAGPGLQAGGQEPPVSCGEGWPGWWMKTSEGRARCTSKAPSLRSQGHAGLPGQSPEPDGQEGLTLGHLVTFFCFLFFLVFQVWFGLVLVVPQSTRDLSSPTWDGTCVPCSGSAES